MKTWLVQSNLIQDHAHNAIKSACERLGINFIPVAIIPFSDELTFTPPEGSLAFYGSTSLIKSVEKSNINKDGFLFDSEKFRSSLWVQKLGKRMLNWDATFCSLEEATKLEPGTFFMKPDNDLKDFSGSIVDIAGISKFFC